jgi:preprotein translocase subunit SecE
MSRLRATASQEASGRSGRAVGFVREVRQEVSRVTWPTRKETLVTTGLVLALSALAALFFVLVDWIIAGAMRLLFGLGA